MSKTWSRTRGGSTTRVSFFTVKRAKTWSRTGGWFLFSQNMVKNQGGGSTTWVVLGHGGGEVPSWDCSEDTHCRKLMVAILHCAMKMKGSVLDLDMRQSLENVWM